MLSRILSVALSAVMVVNTAMPQMALATTTAIPDVTSPVPVRGGEHICYKDTLTAAEKEEFKESCVKDS